MFRTLTRNVRHPPPRWSQQSSSPFCTKPLPDPKAEKRGGSKWSKVLLSISAAIAAASGFMDHYGYGVLDAIHKINEVEKFKRYIRLSGEPLKGNELNGSWKSLEFRKIQCKGVFDEKKSIFVGPRSKYTSKGLESGYHVITPLTPVPDDPESIVSPILVNRGWVPSSWRDNALAVPEDEPLQISSMSTPTQDGSWWRFWANKPVALPNVIAVEVVGVIRGSEKPAFFYPRNDPDASRWYYVDVPVISRACGLEETTVYVEETNEHVIPSGPFPVPKDFSKMIRYYSKE